MVARQVVCSFDGDTVLLDEAQIAITSIVNVGKEEIASNLSVDKTTANESPSGFVTALLSGNKNEVESYFPIRKRLQQRFFLPEK